MMNRKAFMTMLAAALLPAPQLHAQPVDKDVRIGLLAPSTGPSPSGTASPLLAINLKTARTLGLTVPPSILYRAERVVE